MQHSLLYSCHERIHLAITAVVVGMMSVVCKKIGSYSISTVSGSPVFSFAMHTAMQQSKLDSVYHHSCIIDQHSYSTFYKPNKVGK